MGGGGKITVGHKYFLGAHMVLCHGPIDKVVRIEVGGNEAWVGEADASSAASTRVTIDKPKLFGGEKREGGIAGDIDLLSGHPDQARNDYLLDKIGSALLSAYRGVTSVVLRQCYLGVNPYLKPWKFTAQRIHTRGDGSAQWYDEKAEISVISGTESPISPSDLWEYGIYPEEANPGHENLSVPNTFSSSGVMSFGDVQTPSQPPPESPATLWPIHTVLWVQKTIEVPAGKTVRIGIVVENGCLVFLNGSFVAGLNRDNEQPGGLGYDTHYIYLSDSGTHDLQIKAYDEAGSSGNTFLKVTADILFTADMNPAHIIRECLTDNIWGRGLPESEIGPSFTSAADQLFNEGLGLSFLWSEEAPVEEFVSEVLRHIDAVRYEDPETGLQELKLIRGNYDIGTLPVLDRSNSKITKFEIPALSELTNQVTVKYHKVADDNDAAITVQDTAAITMVGTIINQTYEYPGITNDTVASMVAQRDLAANSRPFARGAVTTNRTVADLKPGDVFILNEPDQGIDSMICRVAKRKDNGALNGEIALEFGEDVFGTEYSIFTQPPASGWTDPIGPAENFPQQTAFELPYVHLVRRLGDSYVSDVPADIGYVAFAGSEPTGSNHINYELFVYPDGETPLTGDENAVVGDFTEVAIAMASIGPDDASVAIEPFAGPESHSAGEFVLIGNAADSEREIAVLATDLDPGDTAIFLSRGVADTIPRVITTGDSLYLFHDDYAYSTDEFATGETAEAYATPSTGRDEYSGSFTYHDVDIANRVHLPYPPANVKIDGEYAFTPVSNSSNQIALTWNHRDRVLQSNVPVHWFVGSDYGPESGTTYRLEVDARDDTGTMLQANYVNRDLGLVASETLDLDIDVPPAGTRYVDLRLYSVRQSLDCLQPFEATAVILTAPLNLTAENIEESA